MRSRAAAGKIGLTLVSFLVALLLAEASLRALIFSDFALSASLRDARRYADNASDDFWKLKHRWGLPARAKTHPLLGWLKDSIEPQSFAHEDAAELAGRRPVLLYGDSFAQGAPGAEPFHQILNRDETFSDQHYLLNYGVSGYGLDQIYLLFRNSVDLYDDPVVVFSLLVGDVNRSMLSVREGQKPYFAIVDGQLKLRGLPIDPDSERFFADHPPRIRSYFWNLLLYHTDRPGALLSYLRDEERKRARLIELNGALLGAVHEELRARDLDFVFLVFRGRNYRVRSNWRADWLRQRLGDLGDALIWAPDVLERDAGERPVSELFLPDGHPNTLNNRIIAREIKRLVARIPRRGEVNAGADRSHYPRTSTGKARFGGAPQRSIAPPPLTFAEICSNLEDVVLRGSIDQ